MPAETSASAYPVLVLAATRRDWDATRQLLERAAIHPVACTGAATLATEIQSTVGAIVLTDAAFRDPQIEQLTAALSRQPPWSDIPIILLCQSGPQSPLAARILQSLSNVTMLERPTSSRTLLSSVQAAIRARRRQYQMREQFDALRQSEERLRSTESALRHADYRKDLFLATLAHELRNPLAPIRTSIQILASPQLSAEKLQWVQQVIQRQAKHMSLLLDDLLDVARITQGKLVLKTQRVTLTSVVDAAVETARPLLDDKKHRLMVTLPAVAPILNADPLRLSQILSNLLTNAAKYTNPGGQIRIICGVESDVVHLCVQDNGIGIPSEALSRIFEMFSQVDVTSERSGGGLGIGLSLVKGLVELHGGTIEARSEGPGRGSEFIVHLRLAAIESSSTKAETPEVDAPLTTSGRRRILVADDNRDAADSLAMLLRLAGHDVRVAHNGRAALALAQAFRPDTALLDIGMPDLDGYQVAQELRRATWGPDICLIALTGRGQDSDRRRANDAGFNHHMIKPVDPVTLQAMIAKESVPGPRG
jgi:signal transduction histidine kinase/ActR/RegA family two-component response regulator